MAYAPEFIKQPEPYSNQVPFASNNNASTISSKLSRASPTSGRKGRWDPKTVNGPEESYDDINDRETADYETVVNSPAAGGLHYQPARQALSNRPAVPRSHLVSSAKMQMGARMPQPSATLHINDSILPENPLIGYSGGDRQRR